MKFMVTVAIAFASLSAHAVTLRTCVVQNTPKNSSYTSEKTVYLANGRGNFVQAGENTKLFLSLASVGPNADVWVNGQMMFIFKGNVENGSYESASDRGTIRCDQGQEVPFVYQSRPGGVTEAAGSYMALAGCYAGEVLAVKADLSKITGTSTSAMSTDARTGTITVPAIERQCVKGHGTNPDDYVCEKYGNVKVTYAIENCDYDPTARP